MPPYFREKIVVRGYQYVYYTLHNIRYNESKMVQPWLEGVKRRSVETDFLYYDPPGRIWEIVNRRTWDYGRSPDFMKLRDLAMMCFIYWTSSRVSEVVRAQIFQKKGEVVKHIGSLPSIKASQFVAVEKDFLNFRGLRIVKRRVANVADYPIRNEIRFPLTGDLSVFTDPIVEYLEHPDLGPDAELFPFMRKRAFQIVSHCTQLGDEPGYMIHTLREMGLKFRLRLFDRNLKTLQNFSGHKRVENLLRYLAEIEDTQAILDYKFEDVENK